MRKTKDKLVDNTVDAYRSTYKLKIRIWWIVEYEMVSVEGG
jgi:hypothetical protein